MTNSKQQRPGNPGPWRTGILAAIIGGMVLAGAGLWYQSTGPDKAPETAQKQPGGAAPVATLAEDEMSQQELEGLSKDEVTDQQKAAMSAVADTVGSAPLEGPLTQRPGFVSQVEWTIFRSVARKHADPEMKLVDLVNRLRFHKQKELWENLAGAGQQQQRAALAEQLLEEIPWRLDNQELDRAGAHRLQLEILQEHISDPRERNRRAAREAERIGVTFDIGNS